MSPLPLINIRRGKLEGVLDQFDTGFLVLGQDHFHNIKTEENVRIVEHAQPGEAAAGDPFLFVATNSFKWPAKIFASARFYFHENQCVVVGADDVDLAPV